MDGGRLARVVQPREWIPVGRLQALRERLNAMRLVALLLTATLMAAPFGAQQPATSPAQDAEPLNLPVSLDRIKEALEQPPSLLSLRTVDERPTFRVQIQERMKIEELLASLNMKAGPVPAGGVYMAEQQRIMFPSVDNPLVQPYAAFNQGELLTILIENLARKYIGDRLMSSISKAERARAEAAAREEVRSAVLDYCNAQPNAGSGLALCSSVGR
jgi:hypothetical protein